MSKYELVILGSGGVGKSAITIQFIQGNFVEKYDPTIEDSYRKDVVVDGESCMLDILDTAGQEEYEGMRDEYMRSGQGFILVYSITDQSSFHDLEDIHSKLLKAKDADGDEVPVVLIGNKCDLDSERQVKDTEGKDMAKRFGRYTKFIEASAKSRINIDEIFTEMIRLINRQEKGEPPEDEEEAAAAAAEDDTAQGGAAGGGDKQGDADGGAADKSDGGDKGRASSGSGGAGASSSPAVSGSGGAGAGGAAGGGSGKRGKKARKKTVVAVDASEYTSMMSSLPAANARPSSGDGKKSIICYDFDAEKSENLSTTQISEVPDAGEWVNVRWVSMEGPLSAEDAAAVVERFHIHPVATEDLLSDDVRPKLDLYANSIHVAAALFVRPDGQSPFAVHPVNIFLFENAIVTHISGPADALSTVKAQISDAESPVRKNGPTFLLYQVLLALSNSCGPVADTFRTQLETIEQTALSMPNTELLKQVYVLRRELLLLRKHLQPMIEVLTELEQRCASEDNNDLMDAEQRPYFTSVKNKLRSTADVLSTYSDMCDSITNIKADPQHSGKNCVLM